MTLIVPRGTTELLDEMLAFARQGLAKASVPAVLEARAALFADVTPALEAELVAYFDGFLARAGIAKDAAFPLDPDAIDWILEGDELGKVLLRWVVRLGTDAFAGVADQLALTELRFDLEGPVTAPVRAHLGQLITGINDTTRATVTSRVELAIARGYSIEQLVAGVDGLVGLRDLFGSRAHTIALTETATAYNLAAAAGYQASGLVDEVEIFDGPDCGWTDHDDPDLAHGSVRPLAEWQDHPISHPNCQRAAGPVVLR